MKDSSAERFICEKDVKHCFTSLVIDNAFTMIHGDSGKVYAKNRRIFLLNNDKEIPIENVITADGWNTTQPLLTANKSMPGPSLFLYQHQKITIIVHNHLLNEGITIHWHGIDQKGWPAMDGVACHPVSDLTRAIFQLFFPARFQWNILVPFPCR